MPSQSHRLPRRKPALGDSALSPRGFFVCYRFFFFSPCTDHSLFYINSLGERSCVHCRKKSLSQKHHLASQSGDSCTCLQDTWILIQVLKIMCWQENFLLISQLLFILERRTRIVYPSYHIIQWESELLEVARAYHFQSVSTHGCVLAAHAVPSAARGEHSLSQDLSQCPEDLNILPLGRQTFIWYCDLGNASGFFMSRRQINRNLKGLSSRPPARVFTEARSLLCY